MAVGSWRYVLCVSVSVWWVWGLRTAGGQSPGCHLLMTQTRTKGVCCMKDWRLYVFLYNRPTAGHPMETMDTQTTLINNNLEIHVWLYRTCTHSSCVFTVVSLRWYFLLSVRPFTFSSEQSTRHSCSASCINIVLYTHWDSRSVLLMIQIWLKHRKSKLNADN